jgi:hypothetical protein
MEKCQKDWVMIIKYLLPFVLLLQSNLTAHSQNKIEKNIYYDVDNFPVLRFDSINNSLIVNYYIITKKKVSNNIQFIGGYDALSTFCDSLYYNREDYNYDELNALAMFTILLDKELKIKDIRIVKRIAYDNLTYDYDGLIKKILFSTDEKWIKKDNIDHSEWYFYLGYFKLR